MPMWNKARGLMLMLWAKFHGRFPNLLTENNSP
jgi:hypothetical protein